MDWLPCSLHSHNRAPLTLLTCSASTEPKIIQM
uniref:Uncharacterized protein n=1 Tax=Anguilla anguilla TaxID=7936 RepID=A0A0E9UL19_ANGAN